MTNATAYTQDVRSSKESQKTSGVVVNQQIIDNINKSYVNYMGKMEELSDIVGICNKCIISGDNVERDDQFGNLFKENKNLFSGLYLIAACSYVEYFLKDSYEFISKYLHEKIEQACLPCNFIDKYIREKDIKGKGVIGDYRIKYRKAEFSAYPTKVLDEFSYIGVRLHVPNEQMEEIKSIITKRNNIVHHNNKSSNLSFDDVRANIDSLSQYMTSLKEIILENCRY